MQPIKTTDHARNDGRERPGDADTAAGATDVPPAVELAEHTAPTLSVGRRSTLGLLGVGLLGLTSGRATAAPGRGNQPFYTWTQDVDADGFNLEALGGLQFGDDRTVSGLLGENLTIDADGQLVATDTRTAVSHDGAPVAANVTDIDFAGGLSVSDDGDGSVTVDADTDDTWTDTGGDGLLRPAGFDGIEVERVAAPDDEPLTVEAGEDLVVRVTGGTGALRLETGGGHTITLSDEAGAASVSITDSGGNSIAMDAATGEVTIAAASKLTFDAPEIAVSAGQQLDLGSGLGLDVSSAGPLGISSASVLDIDGSLVRLNGPGAPAARQGDAISVLGSGGVIAQGSPTVHIGE